MSNILERMGITEKEAEQNPSEVINRIAQNIRDEDTLEDLNPLHDVLARLEPTKADRETIAAALTILAAIGSRRIEERNETLPTDLSQLRQNLEDSLRADQARESSTASSNSLLDPSVLNRDPSKIDELADRLRNEPQFGLQLTDLFTESPLIAEQLYNRLKFELPQNEGLRYYFNYATSWAAMRYNSQTLANLREQTSEATILRNHPQLIDQMAAELRADPDNYDKRNLPRLFEESPEIARTLISQLQYDFPKNEALRNRMLENILAAEDRLRDRGQPQAFEEITRNPFLQHAPTLTKNDLVDEHGKTKSLDEILGLEGHTFNKISERRMIHPEMVHDLIFALDRKPELADDPALVAIAIERPDLFAPVRDSQLLLPPEEQNPILLRNLQNTMIKMRIGQTLRKIENQFAERVGLQINHGDRSITNINKSINDPNMQQIVDGLLHELTHNPDHFNNAITHQALAQNPALAAKIFDRFIEENKNAPIPSVFVAAMKNAQAIAQDPMNHDWLQQLQKGIDFENNKPSRVRKSPDLRKPEEPSQLDPAEQRVIAELDGNDQKTDQRVAGSPIPQPDLPVGSASKGADNKLLSPDQEDTFQRFLNDTAEQHAIDDEEFKKFWGGKGKNSTHNQQKGKDEKDTPLAQQFAEFRGRESKGKAILGHIASWYMNRGLVGKIAYGSIAFGLTATALPLAFGLATSTAAAILSTPYLSIPAMALAGYKVKKGLTLQGQLKKINKKQAKQNDKFSDKVSDIIFDAKFESPEFAEAVKKDYETYKHEMDRNGKKALDEDKFIVSVTLGLKDSTQFSFLKHAPKSFLTALKDENRKHAKPTNKLVQQQATIYRKAYLKENNPFGNWRPFNPEKTQLKTRALNSKNFLTLAANAMFKRPKDMIDVLHSPNRAQEQEAQPTR